MLRYISLSVLFIVSAYLGLNLIITRAAGLGFAGDSGRQINSNITNPFHISDSLVLFPVVFALYLNLHEFFKAKEHNSDFGLRKMIWYGSLLVAASVGMTLYADYCYGSGGCTLGTLGHIFELPLFFGIILVESFFFWYLSKRNKVVVS